MAEKKGTAIVSIELSHERPRVLLRRPSDGGTPALPAAEAVPFQDPKTGRITNGKEAAKRSAEKRRALKELREHGEGIATLNPEKCPVWLREHVRDGAGYAMTLAGRFTDPALARLVGTAADAYVLYRALAALGANGDAKAFTEARAWQREHRACLRELASLAALVVTKGGRDGLAAAQRQALGEEES